MSDYYCQQLEQAIRKLGTHWVLHPDNRVPKLDQPLPDTFKWEPRVLTVKAKRGKQ